MLLKGPRMATSVKRPDWLLMEVYFTSNISQIYQIRARQQCWKVFERKNNGYAGLMTWIAICVKFLACEDIEKTLVKAICKYSFSVESLGSISNENTEFFLEYQVPRNVRGVNQEIKRRKKLVRHFVNLTKMPLKLQEFEKRIIFSKQLWLKN